MRNTRPNRIRRAIVEAMEPRDPPAGLDLAGLAAAIGNSPVVTAARTALVAYKVGQLAYTGHTSLLFGAVQISQPFALRNLVNGRQSLVAPVSIRHAPLSSPSPFTAKGAEDSGRHARATIHEHGHAHGHGHHRGWDHATFRSREDDGQGEDRGD